MSAKYMQAVPVVIGAGAIKELADHVKSFGAKKVMCVYTSDLAGSAAVERAHASLEAGGVHYIDFGKIHADPPSDIVDEGGELARAEKIDCLVGIGGGSSMDASKAIAVLVGNPGSIVNYLQDPPLEIALTVPVIMIPTTAGTGSEVSTVAIVTNINTNTKPALAVHGALALVDPELTASMPARLTANTGMDVLCHSLETITGKDNPNPLSTAAALDAIRKVMHYLPTAVADGSNMEARTNMAIAANLAGIGISNNHCHLGHAIADGLSATFHTPHGFNCILGEAEMMKLVGPCVPKDMDMIAEAMGLNVAGADTETVVDAVVEAIRKLMRECNIPSMKEVGWSLDQVLSCSGHIMANFLTTRCPLDVTEDQVIDVLTKSYNNYQ